jgi:secreted PhoX family phosphatase
MSDPEACAFTTAWVRANIIPAVGGTTAQFHVPRAEDCEILPGSGRDVVVALTSARRAAADPTTYGALRLIREASSHPDNVDFTWRDLIEGGPESGVANPDNIAFSRGDGLWLTSDISTNSINLSSAFAFHGNNALYHVPLEGRNANVAFRFANAPLRAELTGPTFVGNETLFVSVQHPGEPRDSELDQPIDVNLYPSWWPDGNKTAGTNPSKPKPSVVVITKH